MSILMRKQHKIFNPIIRTIFVNMMDNFFRVKTPPKILLHNKTVFKNITTVILVRMIRLIDVDITIARNYFSTFPTGMFFSCIIGFYSTSAHFIFSRLRKFSTQVNFMPLFKTSLIRKTFGSFIPSWFSSFVYSCRHFITLKIKAAFGGLKETVMFPHLRRQILDIKNLFPLSNLSITQSMGLSI